jgi:4a-hydroxytetrahydrobiopterin dehydratase
MAVLSESELERELETLDGWEIRDGALRKRFDFPDFGSALAYANRVGEAAEEADHHPDLLVTWGAVEVAWVTHSEGGITSNDVRMARRSDELAA